MRHIVLYWLFFIALMSCNQKKIYSCDELDSEAGIYRVHKTQIPVTGTMICYNNDGKKNLEENFLNGLDHGRKIEWDERGNVRYECNFRYGQQHGRQTYYYDNGKIMRISFFKFDREDSTTSEYYPDGKLKSQGSYKFNDSDLSLKLRSIPDSVPMTNSAGDTIGMKRRGLFYYKPKNGYWEYWDDKGNKSIELYDNGKLLYRMDSIPGGFWIDRAEIGSEPYKLYPTLDNDTAKTKRD